MKFLVITGKHINTVPIEPLLPAAIPAPPGIGTRVAPVTFAAPDAFFIAFAVFNARAERYVRSRQRVRRVLGSAQGTERTIAASTKIS